jgi:hypothetical protein
MDVRVIYRTCPTCGHRFGQPDDPAASAASAPTPANKPPTVLASASVSRPASEPRTTPAAASARNRPAAPATAPGATRRPMPAAAASARSAGPVAATEGRTPSTTTRPAHDRARRRYEGLHAKAASTGFPEEADACRAKAEQLRAKYGI